MIYRMEAVGGWKLHLISTVLLLPTWMWFMKARRGHPDACSAVIGGDAELSIDMYLLLTTHCLWITCICRHSVASSGVVLARERGGRDASRSLRLRMVLPVSHILRLHAPDTPAESERSGCIHSERRATALRVHSAALPALS